MDWALKSLVIAVVSMLHSLMVVVMPKRLMSGSGSGVSTTALEGSSSEEVPSLIMLTRMRRSCSSGQVTQTITKVVKMMVKGIKFCNICEYFK